MKIWSYIWKVIVGLITLAVVFAIFSAATTKFETLVFSILILIYISITGFSSVWAMTHIESLVLFDNEFFKLQQLVNKDYVENNEEARNEMLEEVRENKKNIQVKFYINAVFQFIIYIVCLYNIFSALNSY